jgi:hypothetical protein
MKLYEIEQMRINTRSGYGIVFVVDTCDTYHCVASIYTAV